MSDSKRVAFVSETLVFSADIKTYTDYYAFGMEMVGRNWSESEAYRFGHNGQEKSKEVGEDNYTAEFWEYDSQVIRRFNTDPIVKEYESPYLAFGGNPIWFSDVNGDDASNGEDPPADGKKGDKFLWDGVPFIHDGKDWINESSKDLPDCIITGRKMTRTESFMESYYERKRQDGEWLYTNITRPIIEYTPVVSGAVNSYESYQRGDSFGVGLGIFSSTFDVFGGKLISAGFGLLQKRSSRLFTNAMSDASGVVDDIPFIERSGNSIRIGNDKKTMANWNNMIKTPADGSFNVLLHGDIDYFVPNGYTNKMYAKEVARIMYQNGYQKETPINLISCFSGYGSNIGEGAAYQLFRFTKAPIKAPTNLIQTLKGGSYIIYDGGKWRTFNIQNGYGF